MEQRRPAATRCPHCGASLTALVEIAEDEGTEDRLPAELERLIRFEGCEHASSLQE